MKLAIKIFLIIVVVSLIGWGMYFIYSNNNNDLRQTEECKDTPRLEDNAVRMVTKVIDGDTVLIEGGYSVRLLGIDTDERNKPCYNTAKERLEELVLNKEVILESGNDDLDQWCRYLRYLFLDDLNIGLEMVKEGYGVARASTEGSKYQSEIALAEKNAIDNKIGCKWGGYGAIESNLINRDKTYQWSELTPELTNLKKIESCSADEYYNKEVIVEGWVADAYRSQTDTVFLNFEEAYPNQCFVGVIFNSDQDQFIQNPEEYYSNQMIRIKGIIEEYKGKSEIILKSSDQIEVGREE
ncbi:MAG: thermonuclease family protein [Candidatus Portnoybacteria bacterium]|nr:thermonuclease family protein [Candidatus Portnoybacteria bacterium]